MIAKIIVMLFTLASFVVSVIFLGGIGMMLGKNEEPNRGVVWAWITFSILTVAGIVCLAVAL